MFIIGCACEYIHISNFLLLAWKFILQAMSYSLYILSLLLPLSSFSHFTQGRKRKKKQVKQRKDHSLSFFLLRLICLLVFSLISALTTADILKPPTLLAVPCSLLAISVAPPSSYPSDSVLSGYWLFSGIIRHEALFYFVPFISFSLFF